MLQCDLPGTAQHLCVIKDQRLATRADCSGISAACGPAEAAYLLAVLVMARSHDRPVEHQRLCCCHNLLWDMAEGIDLWLTGYHLSPHLLEHCQAWCTSCCCLQAYCVVDGAIEGLCCSHHSQDRPTASPWTTARAALTLGGPHYNRQAMSRLKFHGHHRHVVLINEGPEGTPPPKAHQRMSMRTLK